MYYEATKVIPNLTGNTSRVLTYARVPNSMKKVLKVSDFFVREENKLKELIIPHIKPNEEFVLSRKPRGDAFEWTAKVVKHEKDGQVKRNPLTGKKITALKVKIKETSSENPVTLLNKAINNAIMGGKNRFNLGRFEQFPEAIEDLENVTRETLKDGLHSDAPKLKTHEPKSKPEDYTKRIEREIFDALNEKINDAPQTPQPEKVIRRITLKPIVLTDDHKNTGGFFELLNFNELNKGINEAVNKGESHFREEFPEELYPESILEQTKPKPKPTPVPHNAQNGDVVVYQEDVAPKPTHAGIVFNDRVYHATAKKGTHYSKRTLGEAAVDDPIVLFKLNAQTRARLDEAKMRATIDSIGNIPINSKALTKVAFNEEAYTRPTSEKFSDPEHYRVEEKSINRLKQTKCAQFVTELFQTMGIFPKEIRSSKMTSTDLTSLKGVFEPPVYLGKDTKPIPKVGTVPLPTQKEIEAMVAKRKEKLATQPPKEKREDVLPTDPKSIEEMFNAFFAEDGPERITFIM